MRESYTIGFRRWLISINKITFYMIVKSFYCLTRFGQNRQFGPGYRCLVHKEFWEEVISSRNKMWIVSNSCRVWMHIWITVSNVIMSHTVLRLILGTMENWCITSHWRGLRGIEITLSVCMSVCVCVYVCPANENFNV